MRIEDCDSVGKVKRRCEGKINHLASLGLTLQTLRILQGIRNVRNVDAGCAAKWVEAGDDSRL